MRKKRWLTLAVAATLVAAACGGDDSTTDGGTAQPGGGSAASTTQKQPVAGGVLTFTSFSEPASLDPGVSTGSGTTGATEMAAVYDTIMRYNPQTKQYENRTAESVTSNDSGTEWTIKLKPGIKFSDGTDYDAEAVAFGMNRHRVGAARGFPATDCAKYWICPRNGTSSGVYMNLVQDIQVVDKVTIKVTMAQAWPGFPYALSDEVGMIPSPTALKKCDATKPIRECEFTLKPVGAGPFIVDSFRPKEAITMSKNPNYWGGTVYLDGFKIININDQGGDKSYDTFRTGTAQMVYLRTPETVEQSKKDKAAGFSEINHGGGLILLNMGGNVNCANGQPATWCAGKPDGPTPTAPATRLQKVRSAVAAAIDPKQIDARANAGVGAPGSELFQKDFNWDPGVPGPKFDPEAAKKLVQEAKAEGWDGKLRMLYSNGKFAVDVAQVTAAMLTAVGIQVDVDTTKDTTAQVVQVSSQRDFELSGWGTNITNDDGAVAALAQNLSSTSTSNRVGYKNEAVDKAINDLWSAKTDDQKKALYKIIAENVYKDLPMLAWSKIEARVISSPKVNGIMQNHSGVFFVHQAWLDK